MYNAFNVNFNRLIGLLTPVILRKPKMISWLQVLVSPIASLHYKFQQKRELDLYKLAHNGQVCYLRKVLNDAFDPSKRRIEITDGSRFTPQYIYTEAEEKPTYLGEMYLRDESVYEDTGVDFIVLLPFEIWEEHKTKIRVGEYRFYDIERIIDFYRLASKRYKIEFK
ncbi:hypothetical protein R8G64_13105 [Tenacibaculum maritimum]|uniref:hypothetical protein n=1 Tax=Tenacibaculum maritimum TaxID=107401 RepID=UPI0012E4059E|nr:hypothetical protein [Tenacibaculum maritimum]MDB0600125.1 hypothetical protein [Tenacibaculum maritimum]MDB0610742.1 hypothetical protein [Tenacibaculum maritimum]CAA0260776.1 conserved hypothetical protein [Tenacibaculum maritimum]